VEPVLHRCRGALQRLRKGLHRARDPRKVSEVVRAAEA
jgi:hypothetical protein